MEDLKKEQQTVKLRIVEKELALRKRFQKVPGELFYSGMDKVIPNFLTGRVSAFALNAGKGYINNFLSQKAVKGGGFKLLEKVKPSGILKKLRSAYTSVVKKKQ